MTSGTEKRQRNRIIRVRVTDAEQAAIRTHAEATGRKEVATYLRELGLSGLNVPGKAERWAAVATLGKLGADVARLGNNLNQLAHEANLGSFPQAETLAAALADLSALRLAILREIEAL